MRCGKITGYRSYLRFVRFSFGIDEIATSSRPMAHISPLKTLIHFPLNWNSVSTLRSTSEWRYLQKMGSAYILIAFSAFKLRGGYPTYCDPVNREFRYYNFTAPRKYDIIQSPSVKTPLQFFASMSRIASSQTFVLTSNCVLFISPISFG